MQHGQGIMGVRHSALPCACAHDTHRAAAGYRSRSRPSSASYMGSAVLGFEPPANMPNRPPAHMLAPDPTPSAAQQQQPSTHVHTAWAGEGSAAQAGTGGAHGLVHGASGHLGESMQQSGDASSWVVEDVDGFSATYEGKGPPGRSSNTGEAAGTSWVQGGSAAAGQARQRNVPQPQLSRSMSHPTNTRRQLQQSFQAQQQQSQLHHPQQAADAPEACVLQAQAQPQLPAENTAAKQERLSPAPASSGPVHAPESHLPQATLTKQPLHQQASQQQQPSLQQQQSQPPQPQQQEKHQKELAELRKLVDQLRSKNKQLEGALAASQQEAASLAAGAAAAASQREAEHNSAMAKQLKLLK